MKVTIIPNEYIGKPNKNCRVYTQEAVQQMADAINLETPVMLCYPSSYDQHINFMSVTHTVRNAEITNRGLEAEVTPMKTEDDYSGFVFRPTGIGSIDKDGTIKNYQLKGINIIPKDRDSFEEILNSDAIKTYQNWQPSNRIDS